MNYSSQDQYVVEQYADTVHGVAACQEVVQGTGLVANNRSVLDNSLLGLGFGSLHDSFDFDYENDGAPTVSNNLIVT